MRRLIPVQFTHSVSLFLTLFGTTAETEYQVKGGLLLDVVVVESTAILELLACEDQALLIGWYAK